MAHFSQLLIIHEFFDTIAFLIINCNKCQFSAITFKLKYAKTLDCCSGNKNEKRNSQQCQLFLP